MDCAGAHHIKKCGGRWAMDMYERDGKPDDVPKGAKYVGCFADRVRDRALKFKYKKSSKMDYDVRTDGSFTCAASCVRVLLSEFFSPSFPPFGRPPNRMFPN